MKISTFFITAKVTPVGPIWALGGPLIWALLGSFIWARAHWAHSFGPGPNGPILRFCHEWGQNKRWGAVRRVKRSGISMRVFLIFIFLRNKTVVRSADVSCFVDVFLTKSIFPKMLQKCLGGVWDHPRPIRDHFGPILDQHLLHKNIRRIPIKSA